MLNADGKQTGLRKGLKTWERGDVYGDQHARCETGGDGCGGWLRGNHGTSLEILWLRLRASTASVGDGFQGTKISRSEMHVVWLCSVVAMQCG